MHCQFVISRNDNLLVLKIMDNRLKNGFAANFVQHVKKFMLDVDIVPSSGRAFLAISAGRDSMALLHCLSEIKLDLQIVALHVNHGTRSENIQEQLFVEKSCEKLSIPLHTICLKDQLEKDATSNFEFTARKLRYQFFQSFLEEGDLLYTAHHIDDSFEWSMMQQLKSGSYRPTLGIPVKNGQRSRPFMAVSRAHIDRYIKSYGISYCEDPTNTQLKYDRNYVRSLIVPNMAKRFPGYLKNYVSRSNDLATLMGKSAFSKRAFTPIKWIKAKKKDSFINLTLQSNFYAAKSKITQAIISRSSAERGVLRDQLNKLFEASIAFKRGPITFSGNVEAHIMPGHMTIINKDQTEQFFNRDVAISQMIEQNDLLKVAKLSVKMDFSEFKEYLSSLLEGIGSREGGEEFPLWVVLPEFNYRNKRIPGQKRVHPLWPQTTAALIKREVVFQSAVNLLRLWSKEKSLIDRSLRIIPVWQIPS